MRFQAICMFKMHQFLAILHIMINNNYIYNLTLIKVLKKNLLTLKWAIQGQKGAEMRFSVIFVFSMHQSLPILHIMIENTNIQYLMVDKKLKEDLLAQKWGIQGQIGARMRFQAICQFKIDWFLLSLQIIVEDNNIQYSMVVLLLKVK